jgi:hypothetical protein
MNLFSSLNYQLKFNAFFTYVCDIGEINLDLGTQEKS